MHRDVRCARTTNYLAAYAIADPPIRHSIIHRRKPGPPPQRDPVLHEQERYRKRQGSDCPKDAHRWPDAKFVEHWPRCKREAASEEAPQEGICRGRAGGVQPVRVN
jgi:hypothetical protein